MLGLGIILLVIGAILTFAVSANVEGASLEIIGYILMGAGGIALLVGLFQQVGSGARGRRVSSTKQVTDDGNTVVEEKRID